MPPRSAALIAATLLLSLCTLAYVAYAIRDKQLRATGAYAVVMERVASDADVGAILGRPISRGLWVEAEHADYLTLRVPLRGDDARGTITLVSDVEGMIIESMVLTSGEERIDLLVRDAVKLQSSSAREAWSSGATLIEQGQHGEAVAVLSQAIALEEGMSNAWYLRGKAQMALGEEESAEADLHEAARLDPADPEPLLLLGSLYTEGGRFVECVTAYTTVLGLDSENGEAWYRRALCYEKLRDRRRALAGAREACSAEIEEGCRMEERLRR